MIFFKLNGIECSKSRSSILGPQVCQIWRRVFQMMKPPLKTSFLKITLTKHHYKNVSIAHTSMDDDSSADHIHNAIRDSVRL